MDAPRPRISAPGLVTFELADCSEPIPLLESLQSLVTAYIRVNETCDGSSVQDDSSVLLEGLSGAINSELICETWSMIFRKDLKRCPMFKDLKWCPMFGKLKTVLLNEWCVGANFTALVYFLQHLPILERLTLQIRYYKHSVIETDESYNPKEHFLVSKHLKVVEIYCREEEVYPWSNSSAI